MKTFNKVEDKTLNELAVAFVGGDVDAGDKFMRIVEPKLRNYARKQYTGLELEDLTQEFLLVSVKMCYKFVEKYNDGKNNILGLIYTKCRQRLIDLGRGDQAEMRSSKMVVGYDEDGEAIYENREVSLQTQIGDDGDSTMADRVASDQLSVEDSVFASMDKAIMEKVVSDYAYVTKGRNGQIMPLIYKANIEDWSNEELDQEVANVLLSETGTEPKSDAIRQAKSRAIKSLRKSIESGKVVVDWEL
jgi:hypothetical protein